MSWLSEMLKRRKKEALRDLDVLRFNMNACIAFEWYEDAKVLKTKLDTLEKKIRQLEREISMRTRP